MEQEGINLNVPFLNDFAATLEKEGDRLQKGIFEQAGEEFNLASPKQLGIVLFEKLKLVEKPKKTKTGQYSTAEDVLSALAKEHAVVSDILNWRSIQKLLTLKQVVFIPFITKR
jgi:DNA polymerase-1